MKYQVVDSRYYHDKSTQPIFATSEWEEAVEAANDSGAGMLVVNNSDNERIVYISPYQDNLAIAE